MSRRNRSTWMLALVAPLALVAVACDDDDDPADTTVPPADVSVVPGGEETPGVTLEPGSNLPPSGDVDGTGPDQNDGSTPPLEPVPVP
jgi:hypothetical protein